MKKNIHTIRGMNDCLPESTELWQKIETTIKKVLSSYCYNEIRMPIVERTPLFKRAIGEMTDIVEKEMYSFKDHNGDNLTLRPEGTAGCVRAGIKHGLLYKQEQRLWYNGPMFRHERPQRGRYRQFHQFGAEAFGHYGPDIDAELIMITARCWRDLGISKNLKLELNSIGSLESRLNYQKALIKFLVKHENLLDEDCLRRMYRSPMRVLDTKNVDIQLLLNDAPDIKNYLDHDSYIHFSGLIDILKISGIQYKINFRLVRGLDYYNRTVFEWITEDLGSQRAICAGGRYDNLVEQLGGYATPAVGFSVGLERLVLLIQTINPDFSIKPKVDIYFIVLNNNEQIKAMLIAEHIRDAFPNARLMTNYSGGSLKKQFSRANKNSAHIAIVLRETEERTQKVIIKNLVTGDQEIIPIRHIISKLKMYLD